MPHHSFIIVPYGCVHNDLTPEVKMQLDAYGNEYAALELEKNRHVPDTPGWHNVQGRQTALSVRMCDYYQRVGWALR